MSNAPKMYTSRSADTRPFTQMSVAEVLNLTRDPKDRDLLVDLAHGKQAEHLPQYQRRRLVVERKFIDADGHLTERGAQAAYQIQVDRAATREAKYQ